MTCEAEFYLSIPFAVHFTDHSPGSCVLHLACDSMKFPAIKRLCVKRDRRVVSGLGARDMYFAS